MPGGHGCRARTRDLFQRPFKGKGFIPLTTYLRTYKIGDCVDVKVNAAVQKVRTLLKSHFGVESV
jgi:large subunit ribosomal protein L21e